MLRVRNQLVLLIGLYFGFVDRKTADPQLHVSTMTLSPIAECLWPNFYFGNLNEHFPFLSNEIYFLLLKLTTSKSVRIIDSHIWQNSTFPSRH